MAIETLNYTSPATGSPIATDLVSGSYMQLMKLDGGTDGLSEPITGSTLFGLLVDVSRLQSALPAGDNNIGNVDVLTLPSIPAGNNPIGSIVVSSGTVQGSLFHNNDSPSGNNIGVLPAIATASTPTYLENKQVLLSTDLNGFLRIVTPTNNEATILASAARTVTTQSSDQTNNYYKRLIIIVNISANAGAIKIRPVLQVKDPISSNYDTVWTGGADLTALGTFSYYFSDGASGGSWQQILPFGHIGKIWRFQMNHGNANSITYSVAVVEMW